MSTRATYLFSNTALAGEDVCVYIHHDGYPSGAAQYLSRAKNLSSKDKRPLLESFIAANKGAEITRCHSTHGDTDYRYSITSTGYGLADITCHSRHVSLEGDDEGFSTHWKEIFSGSLKEFITSNIDEQEEMSTPYTHEDYEDRIAELEKDLEQSIEHIDNLQFCSEERGFFYCPNCGEGTKHTKDCYIGVFLDKHKP